MRRGAGRFVAGETLDEAVVTLRRLNEAGLLRLEPEGLTVVEIAPGVNLERDVLGQSEIPLRVSPDLRAMDRRLFVDAPMDLLLREEREERTH